MTCPCLKTRVSELVWSLICRLVVYFATRGGENRDYARAFTQAATDPRDRKRHALSFRLGGGARRDQLLASVEQQQVAGGEPANKRLAQRAARGLPDVGTPVSVGVDPWVVAENQRVACTR
jgi:hypothetical protein